jgi:hypothetical protein
LFEVRQDIISDTPVLIFEFEKIGQFQFDSEKGQFEFTGK